MLNSSMSSVMHSNRAWEVQVIKQLQAGLGENADHQFSDAASHCSYTFCGRSPEMLQCVHHLLQILVCKTDSHELFTIIVDFTLWDEEVAKEIKDLLPPGLNHLPCFYT